MMTFCCQNTDRVLVFIADAGASFQSAGFHTVYRPRHGGRRFADLLSHVADVNPRMRVRFTSPHPKDFPDDVNAPLHSLNISHLNSPKMADGGRLKNIQTPSSLTSNPATSSLYTLSSCHSPRFKMQNLCSCSTDFDKIWHDNANWPCGPC